MKMSVHNDLYMCQMLIFDQIKNNIDKKINHWTDSIGQKRPSP